MAETNKDLEAQIEALRAEAMSEDELDDVAGGTTNQNWEIISAMGKIDPEGVSQFMAGYQEECAKSHSNRLDLVASGAQWLIGRNAQLISKMTGSGVVGCQSTSESRENVYIINGVKAGHDDMMKLLNSFQGNDF